MLRSHTIGEVSKKLVGKKVELVGWIDSIRSFKAMSFIVLRDRYGKVQCVVGGKSPAFDKCKGLLAESCIKVIGNVKARPKNQVNKDYQRLIQKPFAIQGGRRYVLLAMFFRSQYYRQLIQDALP